MPTPIRKKRPDGKDKSDFWWLRKKVPQRYRAVVGRSEVWRSLATTDRKTAGTRAKLSADLEEEWRLRFEAARSAGRISEGSRPSVSFMELNALRRDVHEQTRDAHLTNPGWALRWSALTSIPDDAQEAEEQEIVESEMDDFLAGNDIDLKAAERDRFLPMFAQARREGYLDLMRASKGDFSPSPVLSTYAPKQAKKLDLIEAFEFYCERGNIKGQGTGPTAKRWRPKIKAFCEFVGHTDLARMTSDDAYRWADHLDKVRKIAKKSIKDVWIASLSATAGFMVERRKLTQNPFAGIRVRGMDDGETNESNQKGFSNSEAAIILDATLRSPRI